MLYTYYFSQKQLEIIEETSSSGFGQELAMRERFVNGMQYTEMIQQTSDSVCSWDDAEVVFTDTKKDMGVTTSGRLL